MSKSFWGGLRVGWIRAERGTLATIAAIRPSVDLGTLILEQLAAARLLAMRAEVLPERREIIRARREFLVALLARELPDWQARARPRRNVTEGEAPRADEHGVVGRGDAAGSGCARGAAVRCGRHAGVVHPAALCAAGT